MNLCGCASWVSHQSPKPGIAGSASPRAFSAWDGEGLHEVLLVQGEALGRARTDCRVGTARTRGVCPEGAAVCDHQVTEDKQKGLDTTGQLEMSAKSKERDKG